MPTVTSTATTLSPLAFYRRDNATPSFELFAATEPSTTDDTVREAFRELAEQVYEQCRYVSSPRQIAESEPYRQIVALGPSVVPYLLDELRDHGGAWYAALRAITGASPVTDADRGSSDRIDAAWLRWGRAAYRRA